MSSNSTPWASGPGEILRHGLSLLKKDNDTNRRLAMISIDNAVELMVKTYLGLPKRITGLAITRKDLQEISESFPNMLDALEKHASTKLVGIDLGEIEWYHRLRNELYHQGNGLTVERDKVEVYAQLANTLFANLFGSKLVENASPSSELLGDFMNAWAALEMQLGRLTMGFSGKPPRGSLDSIRVVSDAKILSPAQVAELESFRLLRNGVVHAAPNARTSLTREIVDRMIRYSKELSEYMVDPQDVPEIF